MLSSPGSSPGSNPDSVYRHQLDQLLQSVNYDLLKFCMFI